MFLLTDGAVSDYGPSKSCVASDRRSGQRLCAAEKMVSLLTGGAVSDYGVVGFCCSGGLIRLIVKMLVICLTSLTGRRGACGIIFPGVLVFMPMLRFVNFPAAG